MSDSKISARKHWLAIVDQELYKCIRCGECRTICPVYAENPVERYTARGKVAMAKALAENEIAFTSSVREALENCLLCTGCASLCSSGVRADKVIMATREMFAEEMGLPVLKKLVGTALTRSEGTTNTAGFLAAKLQKMMCTSVPKDSGLYTRFAMPGVDSLQYIPAIASPSFRQQGTYYPSECSQNSTAKSVTFFTGCMINHSMTEIGSSMVRVLNALGVSVRVPSGQGCCGMPMLASGDKKSVQKQAIRNIEAFSDLPADEVILVACASCGHMLKHGYHDVLEDIPSLLPQIDAVAKRTLDISEYLVQHIGLETLRSVLKKPVRQNVTYHDPCHLRKAQKILSAPRQLLETIPGLTLREMPHAETCCGLGGTYVLSNMALSKDIQSKKIANACSTGADVLATGCPGCIMQLRDGLRRRSTSSMQVRHVITLLASAL